MQSPEQEKPPLGVVFDSDMGNRIDAALALASLYGLDGKREARVISLSVSKPNLKAAAFCEVVARFYAGTLNSGFGRVPPIGMAETGARPEDTPMLTALDRKNAGGAALYPYTIHKLNDTAEVPALIRNAFTAQHDGNCVVVLAGPATNLVKVLELQGAADLIARKVRLLAVAAGAFSGGAPEDHIRADLAAARKLFAQWPTPIVAAGDEVGQALPYPAASIETDFAWSPAHPVADAYRAWKPMPYDAPTTDLAAVLYAVRPQEGYFRLSEPGTLQVRDNGRTVLVPSAEGRHRYLVLDPQQKNRVLKAYTDLASAKPAPRQRHRPPQPKQDRPPAKPQPAQQ